MYIYNGFVNWKTFDKFQSSIIKVIIKGQLHPFRPVEDSWLLS